MATYDYSLCVPESAIDFLGHVNNLQYLSWMIDAAVAHSTDCGWPTKRYLELGSGWVVRSHHVEYLSPAYADDELVVSTWIDNFGKVRCLRKYRVVRISDEREIARGESVWTFIHFDRGVPIRVPQQVLDSFATER